MLVIDDDPATRRLIAGLLVEEGYDAQTALDGEHAQRSAAALHPDLIILDVHVPEKELALRFAEGYRDRVPADRRAPIIALSGASDLEAVGQQLGASAFLGKPFDVEELLRLVARLLPESTITEPAATAEPAPDAPQATLIPLVQPESSQT